MDFDTANQHMTLPIDTMFGGLPRELYFPKGLYFPEVRSTEGKYCPAGKYNYLGTTDMWYFNRPGRYLLY